MEIGDKVTWESQARGRTKTKTGVIVEEIIASKNELWKIRKWYADEGCHTLMFDGYSMPADIAYFVEVYDGPTRKPKLYFPNPKNLKIVKEAD